MDALGLDDTRHIGRLVIDPRNPDIVFVAALGHPTGRTPIAASFALQTAAKPGKKSSIKTTRPAQLTSRSIPAIRTFCSPRSGRAAAHRGASIAAAPAAEFTNRLTVASPGKNSTVKDYQAVH